MYDIAIIGGGINGCGIARDAAGRGYRVFLAEKGDLAQGTSSGSTKLIHGGLRYLEHYEFKLVREALKERELLWSIAPHIIWPMRFVLPHTKGMRPAWMLRTGLFLYDHIGGRQRLPATRTLDLRHDRAGRPLRAGFKTAYEYSDCWVDDARLVVLNALDAANCGADIRTRTSFLQCDREQTHWNATLLDASSGTTFSIRARLVVNAAGPWVDDILSRVAGQNDAANVRLVQGSHLVVPRLFDHDRSYIFQNEDKRIIFAIPYEQDFTLIGTTDNDYTGSPDNVAISAQEVDYICTSVNRYFKTEICAQDVVWSYSAVRPLYNDGAGKAQEATRDYVIKTDGIGEQGRLINIFGGKITTYRRLAETVLDEIDNTFDRQTKRWTDTRCLPGGDFEIDGYEAQVAELRRAYPFLEESIMRRLVRSYGTLTERILGDAKSSGDLGRDFGAGLTEREAHYLQASEWARTSEDILWRRSKLGLRAVNREALSTWISAHSSINVTNCG